MTDNIPKPKFIVDEKGHLKHRRNPKNSFGIAVKDFVSPVGFGL